MKFYPAPSRIPRSSAAGMNGLINSSCGAQYPAGRCWIYSGCGDQGKSSLQGEKQPRKKNEPCFEALGALDELGAVLGVASALNKNKKIALVLNRVQNNLFLIQAEIGTKGKIKKKCDEKKLRELENFIDDFGVEVGPIKNFIVPGGNLLSAHFDLGRAVARRTERQCAALKGLSAGARAYLNRLSSLLFVLARWVNKKNFVKEKRTRY